MTVIRPVGYIVESFPYLTESIRQTQIKLISNPLLISNPVARKSPPKEAVHGRATTRRYVILYLKSYRERTIFFWHTNTSTSAEK